MNYFQQQRQEFIAAFVKKNGYINRRHIMKKFGVNTVTASKDLQKYQELNPCVIEYNARKRRYEIV